MIVCKPFSKHPVQYFDIPNEHLTFFVQRGAISTDPKGVCASFNRESVSASQDELPHVVNEYETPAVECEDSSRNLKDPAHNSEIHMANLDDSTVYEVQDMHQTTQKAGRGLFATKDIPQGSLILKESPFMAFPSRSAFRVGAFREIYQDTSSAQKEKFDHLHERKDRLAHKDRIVNKVMTNAIPIQDDLGLFSTMAMINHCCAPNAGWTWYQDERKMHLYAYTDILVGTQITVSYVYCDDLLKPQSDRQRILSRKFGFICMCETCRALSIEDSGREAQLREYRAMRREWKRLEIEEITTKRHEILQLLQKALKILNEVRLWNRQGQVYDFILEMNAAMGRPKDTRSAALDCLAHYTRVLGRERALTFPLEAVSHDPTQHTLWPTTCPKLPKKAKNRRRARR
ncbi:uncharacterized protein I303_108253 [Kwoniella dejecticola CBS 10117]|uniref:SET domain-containing protein n=1 Tax=Kwoniella dejecticola CBS 10117 TaxID=1296121 RepID=A0A1A5ZXW9_9TREE|nr:uncharacterized protein I303_07420 [Kwoniella dejecticola CBS 10117]OBR82657.1 hypothetical protein I303_07420 [Kwoniella dejecticola CBS 10117]